jgi:cyclophilin family peptidyl-prolyl cis-trans isomerase
LEITALTRTLAALALFLFAAMPLPAAAQANDPENTLYLDLSYGRVVIRLRPDLAPNHVARVKQLARAGFYDGIVFHRVLEGFMAQSGDPTGTGMGGSDEPDLKAEFTETPFVRGVIGAARTDDPDSANSQFFIMFGERRGLNGQYTVWGEVVEGMEFVDQIKRGEPPANPDKIIRMQVAADAG